MAKISFWQNAALSLKLSFTLATIIVLVDVSAKGLIYKQLVVYKEFKEVITSMRDSRTSKRIP